MTSRTPENPQEDRKGTDAEGRGNRTTNAGAPDRPGESGPSNAPSKGGPGSRAAGSGTSASGKPGGNPPKTADKSGSEKPGSDWSVFRTVVVLVGLVIAGFGAYYLITGTSGLPETGDGAVNPTLENQFRFFAAMMVGVGAAFVTIAIKFQWANMLWLVCLMVFIGGIGRVLSWAFSGTPHFLLIILMVVELAFPAALLVWHRYIAKTSELRREYASRS